MLFIRLSAAFPIKVRLAITATPISIASRIGITNTWAMYIRDQNTGAPGNGAHIGELLPLLGELRYYRRFLDEVSAIEEGT